VNSLLWHDLTKGAGKRKQLVVHHILKEYMAGHADPRTTKLDDRRRQQVTRGEVERIRYEAGYAGYRRSEVRRGERPLPLSREGFPPSACVLRLPLYRN
jgi:hypothetical protein